MKIRESILKIKEHLGWVSAGSSYSTAHNEAVAKIRAIVDMLIDNMEPTPKFEKLVMDEIIKLQEEIAAIKNNINEIIRT